MLFTLTKLQRKNAENMNSEEECRKHEFTGTKVIAVPEVSSLFKFIQNGVKVIHLIRDPRSNWVSQMNIQVHEYKITLEKMVTDFQPKRLKAFCKDYDRDLPLLKNILANNNNKESDHHSNMLPYLLDNYRILRYEDIASHPEQWTKSMCGFLQIPMDNKVLNWIKENTNVDSSDGYVCLMPCHPNPS